MKLTGPPIFPRLLIEITWRKSGIGPAALIGEMMQVCRVVMGLAPEQMACRGSVIQLMILWRSYEEILIYQPIEEYLTLDIPQWWFVGTAGH